MKKAVLALVALAAALSVGIPGAFGGGQATPGVTAKLIVLGGTFPLTGAAASYAPIARGMGAYYSYVNARRGPDKLRGVMGRQIKWVVKDDGFNPVNTVQQTRALVEQDGVFATVGALGTEPQQAVREYMNSKKVPQVFVSTGATFWGLDQDKYPWTIGWQPDYQAEGAVYGRLLRNNADAKIAIIYQNDDYGRDYIAGLEAGLGSAKNKIVATRGYALTDASVVSQLTDLRRSGANVLVIFATPTHTIRTYATLPRIGWKPDAIYLNSVSATDTFMGIAVSAAGAAAVNGSVSVQYLKDPANPEWDNDAGMKLYKTIMAKYLPNANPKDGLFLYGMAKAEDFIQVLYKAGKNLTREGLMKAVRNFSNPKNPFALPGAVTKTGGKDQFPISHLRLIRFNNGSWSAIGPLQNPRGK